MQPPKYRPRLNAGKLNRRISIQHYTTVEVDPEGIATEGWTTLAKVWAARTPIRGRDYFQAAANNAEKTVKFVIRYKEGIKSNMRVYDHKDDLTYDIVTPLDDYFGDRTETHLMCELIEDG